MLRIVSGLETSTYGSISYNGRSITKPGTDRGMVFQSYSLYPWLNVEENIAFGLRLKGISKAERLDKAREYCELIGLKDFTKHYPIQLSGGMQQRVAIACALANDPEFFLMDEPFGALDAQTRLIMQEILLKVWEDTGKTILFVTHDVNEAVFLADKVYVMTARPGKLKYIQDIDFERPRHPDINTLLKSYPLFVYRVDEHYSEMTDVYIEKNQLHPSKIVEFGDDILNGISGTIVFKL